MTDASKAVDEAKYEASTSLDKHVLRALQTAALSEELQAAYDIGDPRWKHASDRYLQCLVEAQSYVTRDQLSKVGIRRAKLATCNKKTDEWDEGITR